MPSHRSQTLTALRPAAVAGAFYPEEPTRLSQMLDGLLHTAEVSLDSAPKALIAPHAGYQYSGPIAASAFVPLSGNREIKRVVLLGPSHHLAFPGLALSQVMGFETPLGAVPVDKEAIGQISSLPQVRYFEEAHRYEHSLEVELPFLQQTLGSFTLVPVVVGEGTDEEVGAVVDLLWGGPETLFVISSDLSHYYDYDAANELDRRTARAIEQLRPQDIGAEQACGRIAMRGMLWAARKRGLQAQTLDL